MGKARGHGFWSRVFYLEADSLPFGGFVEFDSPRGWGRLAGSAGRSHTMSAAVRFTPHRPLLTTHDAWPCGYAWVCGFSDQLMLPPPHAEITGCGRHRRKLSEDGVKRAGKTSLDAVAVGLKAGLDSTSTGWQGGAVTNGQGQGSLGKKPPGGT